MESLRKWFYRPKKDDSSLLAQFFFADEALNLIAGELDSFDGRKDPERCTTLVNQLRQSQDKVLTIANAIMDVLIGDQRANRDFRAKFPEDVLQENLAGQLWFGAECLAAGSSIMNREEESTAMRPLARALTKSLENVRNLLRDTCLRSNTPNAPLKLNSNEIINEVLIESLKIFDRLFAEFELCYVSAMVPVKSTQEYELQQLIGVLFSETLRRALKMKLLTQEMIDDCDPALMFTIPRLAIVNGLLNFPDGPLCVDKAVEEMSEMFRPFRTLLHKIRELLWTLNEKGLYMLEKLLCDNEQISDLILVNDLNIYKDLDGFINQFYNDYPLCRDYSTNFYSFNDARAEMVSEPDLLHKSFQSSRDILDNSSIPSTSKAILHHSDQVESHSLLSSILTTDAQNNRDSKNNNDYGSLIDSGVCTENTSLDRSPILEQHGATTCNYIKNPPRHNCLCDQSPESVDKQPVFQDQVHLPASSKNTAKSCTRRNKATKTYIPENEDTASLSSSDTSSFNSNCADDEEIALALQAAEIASRHEVRAKFRSSADLLHRLFVCIAGVADQLQTNFASDLRNILKSVFLLNTTDSFQKANPPLESNVESSIEYHPSPNEVIENNEFTVDPNILAQEALCDENEETSSVYSNRPRSQDLSIPELSQNFSQLVNVGENIRQAVANNIAVQHHIARENCEYENPPFWIPDEEATKCMSCGAPFTVVKRRHHCRNCGKIFCSRCSSNSVTLPKFGHTKPVRVCNKCFMYHLMPFTR